MCAQQYIHLSFRVALLFSFNVLQFLYRLPNNLQYLLRGPMHDYLWRYLRMHFDWLFHLIENTAYIVEMLGDITVSTYEEQSIVVDIPHGFTPQTSQSCSCFMIVCFMSFIAAAVTCSGQQFCGGTLTKDVYNAATGQIYSNPRVNFFWCCRCVDVIFPFGFAHSCLPLACADAGTAIFDSGTYKLTYVPYNGFHGTDTISMGTDPKALLVVTINVQRQSLSILLTPLGCWW